MGNANPISLGKNSLGVNVFQLPHGPKDDDYKITIFIDIYDDSDGITTFVIEELVIVEPNEDKINQLIENFLAPNNSDFLDAFKNASIQTTSTFILSLTAMINNQPVINSTNGSNSVIIKIY